MRKINIHFSKWIEYIHKFNIKDSGIWILLFIYTSLFVFENKNYSITYDSFGYYLYLPAAFHFEDLCLKDINPAQQMLNNESNGESVLYQAYNAPGTKNHVIRYPIGMALSYSPSFLLSYIISEFINIDHQYGFNRIYKFNLFHWSFFISILGILTLYRFLRYYYSEIISIFSIAAILFGTNYLFHSFMHGHGIMSQNYLFSYYAILLYFTKKLFENFRYTHFSIVCLLISLITICRNSEIFCLLIPLIFGLNKFNKIPDLIKLILNDKIKFICSIIPAAVILLTQIIYWKIVTGDYLFYSYQDNPGEQLDIFSPYLMEVMLSFRKGLFVYTPMTILMLSGLFIQFGEKTWNKCIIIFSFINLYIISSWTTWWYSESFGQRAIIPMYALWIMGFANLAEYFLNTKSIKKWIFQFVVIAIIFLNLFQTWQIHEGVLPPNYITRDYYFSTFGQVTKPDATQFSLLLKPDQPGLIEIIPEDELKSLKRDFIYSTDDNLVTTEENKIRKTEEDSTILNPSKPYSKSIIIPNSYLNSTEYKYAKITAKIGVKEYCDTMNFGIVAHMKKGNKFYKWHISKQAVSIFKDKKYHYLQYWYMIPKIGRDSDQFTCYVWNMDSKDLIFYSLTSEIFSPINSKHIFLW